LAATAAVATLGCRSTPVDTSAYERGPAPLQTPSPAAQAGKSYEDCLTGGQVFAMYCNGCHNARSLAERPFASYKNVAAHMRSRANLTGKEYAKLMEWMRRWYDVPPPNAEIEPSPKRLIYSQPIAELQPQGAAAGKPEPPSRQEVTPPAAPLPLPRPDGPSS
jgi:cytochrome c5